MNNIEFEQGKYGIRAVIKSEWQNSFIKQLSDKEVKEIELNDGKGWRGDNVDFLKLFPDLQSLIIIDFSIKSISPVQLLNDLRNLEISTYCKTAINFNSFPKLTDCVFEWRKGSESLFECVTMVSLFINNYDNENSDLFSKLINLEELAVFNSKILGLNGLYSLEKLRKLRLGNLKQLKSLQGIEKLKQLSELEIHRCKNINNISALWGLVTLKKLLMLDLGSIESIKGIENLKLLETFLFYESTNIVDGDLTPLLKLNNLSKISFKNRKHYTHLREDFKQYK